EVPPLLTPETPCSRDDSPWRSCASACSAPTGRASAAPTAPAPRTTRTCPSAGRKPTSCSRPSCPVPATPPHRRRRPGLPAGLDEERADGHLPRREDGQGEVGQEGAGQGRQDDERQEQPRQRHAVQRRQAGLLRLLGR